ncbi:hypothetical protein QN277_013776 [Acacia crassicarpa]|uniref:Uncharacterized protein n=1 Tax=Acacia crassicarpa TaxID=499986 RepID=A0AAE1TG50_9FABA|nr:hypothetical protein QN277_013776 [Acacia crassicarpa]
MSMNGKRATANKLEIEGIQQQRPVGPSSAGILTFRNAVIGISAEFWYSGPCLFFDSVVLDLNTQFVDVVINTYLFVSLSSIDQCLVLEISQHGSSWQTEITDKLQPILNNQNPQSDLIIVECLCKILRTSMKSLF